MHRDSEESKGTTPHHPLRRSLKREKTTGGWKAWKEVPGAHSDLAPGMQYSEATNSTAWGGLPPVAGQQEMDRQISLEVMAEERIMAGRMLRTQR